MQIAGAPGGWRDLSRHELVALGLDRRAQNKGRALQELVRTGYPRLEPLQLANAASVARVYEARLGGLRTEIVLAVGVDGRNAFLREVELATGGRHGASLTPGDVMRPLIRAGASAFILLHNHPSGVMPTS